MNRRLGKSLFQSAERHQRKVGVKAKKRFSVEDFDFDSKKKTVRCPAGHMMWLKCSRARTGRYLFLQFQAHKADCEGCELRKSCLRTETQKTPRLVNIRVEKAGTNLLDQMRSKIDSVRGRYIYSHRLFETMWKTNSGKSPNPKAPSNRTIAVINKVSYSDLR